MPLKRLLPHTHVHSLSAVSRPNLLQYSACRLESHQDKPQMADQKKVYQQLVPEEEALQNLMTFKEIWGKQYPSYI